MSNSRVSSLLAGAIYLSLTACLPKNESIIAHGADPCSGHLFDPEVIDSRCMVAKSDHPPPPPADAMEIELKESTSFKPGEERSLTLELKNVSAKVLPIPLDDDPTAFQASLSNGQVSSREHEATTGATQCAKLTIGTGEIPRIYLAPEGIVRKKLSVKASRQKFVPKADGCILTELGPLPKGDYQLEIILPIREANGTLRKFEKKVHIAP